MKRVGNLKANGHTWVANAMQQQHKESGAAGQLSVTMGLVDPKIGKWLKGGEQFVYLDHSYFKRGWGNGNFRAIRNACHLTKTLKRPDDRLKRFEVVIEPWRRTGRQVVIIPPSHFYERYLGLGNWTNQTFGKLKTLTSRPIAIKKDKGGLREYLADAWAVVCALSVAGVEAALMGVPVFSTPHCPSWPINAGELQNIDKPEYLDRYEWACSLSYASWHESEIDRIRWLDYDYSLCDDVP